MADKQKTHKDVLIAKSGDDKLYYSYTKTDKDGRELQYGCVEKPNGLRICDVLVDSVLSRGYWVPVKTPKK